MKIIQFSLLLVLVLLLSAQCQKQEELDIKPKKLIIQKWVCMGFSTNIRPYDPGDRLELWSDNTYTIYEDSVFKGDGTYLLYTKKDYDWNGNPFLVPIISMTGYDLEWWLTGYDFETYKTEYSYYRFIGDSACPPAYPGVISISEALFDTIAFYNLSDEILRMSCVQSTAPPIYFVKL